MSESTREELRAWVRNLVEVQKTTPSALAKKAGLATTTLTNFMNDDTAPILSSRTIAKIAHAAGVAPIRPGGGAASAPRLASFFAADGAPYRPQAGGAEAALEAAVQALVGDRKSADPWVLQTNVLEMAGYLPGDILIVDLRDVPAAGNVVCAEAYQWSVGRTETVFRIYEPPYLVAASRDASVRKPLVVDNDQVLIKGVVIASLRMMTPHR